MHIPPLALSLEYKEIRPELNRRLKRIFGRGRFVLGEEVRAFESAIAKRIGTPFAVGVASGSDALMLSLTALGVGRGDEVVTTAFTFAATAMSVIRLGATPVFVDIDPDTFNLDPAVIAGRISNRTKVILPVHLYGLPCDMTTLCRLAGKYSLSVIEDCAQAFGAAWKGKSVGTFGDTGAFSFYPTKTLGAYGDAGLVTVKGKKLGQLIRALRVHGERNGRCDHQWIGMNSRLDEMQAAVLNVKLKKMNRWQHARRHIARFYDSLFQKAGLKEIQIPKRPQEAESVFHQYTIRARARNALRKFLNRKGIAAGVYYETPLHLQSCFRYLNYKQGSLPHSERASREVLSLPIYPQLTDSQIRFTAEAVKEFYSKKKR